MAGLLRDRLSGSGGGQHPSDRAKEESMRKATSEDLAVKNAFRKAPLPGNGLPPLFGRHAGRYRFAPRVITGTASLIGSAKPEPARESLPRQ
jgi:hypothetical protein